MKNIHKKVAPLLALIALVTVVFAARGIKTENTDQPAEAPTATAYFRLNSTSIADENDLSKWEYVSDNTPPGDCAGEEVLCSVKAPVTDSSGILIIDANQLTQPINMQTDLNVSDRQFQDEVE